ncbi:hypothetical protein WL40_29140 [Burkholderia ubonensis]|nr:hypothetical protein WJ72_33530 [Burkholderia ubonensis]KVO25048.1 hypothetical protein WJ74_32090 [Burkholderia ubonensis]KVP62783.1 hypothetical protein WJ92_07275 [Burkholderia ubonensis]KVQ68301.1 hypothetical protein WK05_19730 [Burkholderia ubonensis]KVR09335.1 hypothetical protein WK11_06920 [Burkholderia ubonensis]
MYAGGPVVRSEICATVLACVESLRVVVLLATPADPAGDDSTRRSSAVSDERLDGSGYRAIAGSRDGNQCSQSRRQLDTGRTAKQ